MPVTMARLPGFQSAKSARWYQALTGPTQATGSAGGYDLLLRTSTALERRGCPLSISIHVSRSLIVEGALPFDPVAVA